jgi:hypothetical protein
MSEPQENLEDQKKEIIAKIADLSKLLGMIPSDDTVTVNEPVTQNPALQPNIFHAISVLKGRNPQYYP